MTIIAWSSRELVMGCDSSWADGGLITTLAPKIARLPCGALIGEAGDSDVRAVRELLDISTLRPDRLPDSHDLAATRVDYAAILVFSTRRGPRVFDVQIGHLDGRTEWGASVSELVGRPYMCAGNASKFCLGALAAGKSVREAVALTCGWHESCRPPVHVVPLRSGNGHRKKR